MVESKRLRLGHPKAAVAKLEEAARLLGYDGEAQLRAAVYGTVLQFAPMLRKAAIIRPLAWLRLALAAIGNTAATTNQSGHTN